MTLLLLVVLLALIPLLPQIVETLTRAVVRATINALAEKGEERQ